MNNLVDTSKMCFVFGSNEGGIHGGGAARYAYKEKGARWGFSYGHMGQSFAIPTKGVYYPPQNPEFVSIKDMSRPMVGGTLPLKQIQDYVTGFLAYASGHPELTFQVTCIGCGLAGLEHKDIAPMFRGFEHTGLYFDVKWKAYLQSNAKFWGEG